MTNLNKLKQLETEIAEILRDGVTYSGQTGTVVIHGAIREISALISRQVDPLLAEISRLEKLIISRTKEAADLTTKFEYWPGTEQEVILKATAARPSIIVKILKWAGDNHALVSDGFKDYYVHRNEIQP